MKNYSKIFKWLMWALVLISVGVLVWGSVTGFESNDAVAVDVLLRWGYIMVGIALAAVIVVGIVISAINNPKSLIKMLIGLVAIAAVCFVVYLVSPGAPALNLTTEQPSASTLKLTDTIMNLTYLAGGLAIFAIIFGEIMSSVRSK